MLGVALLQPTQVASLPTGCQPYSLKRKEVTTAAFHKTPVGQETHLAYAASNAYADISDDNMSDRGEPTSKPIESDTPWNSMLRVDSWCRMRYPLRDIPLASRGR